MYMILEFIKLKYHITIGKFRPRLIELTSFKPKLLIISLINKSSQKAIHYNKEKF